MSQMFILSVIIGLGLIILFYALGMKNLWNSGMFSTFECGFSSYFFSRFSFSIHYFLVALIFLFLDLEICMIMPLFSEYLVDSISLLLVFMVLAILLGGLVQEWLCQKLEWEF